MPSPAQIHRMRALGAAAVIATAPVRRGQAASEYELQRARLGIDLRRLSDIQALERKIALKRELLPSYAPWVEGVLAAAAEGAPGIQDDVLVQILIWRIDVGDIAAALPLAAYVLRWKLTLPERFKRSTATMIAEECAELALKALGQGEPFDLASLLEVERLTADQDMIDEAKAKLMKALGLLIARATPAADADGPAGGRRAAVETALAYLRRANTLHSSCGVKSDIKRLEREASAFRIAGDVADTAAKLHDALSTVAAKNRKTKGSQA